MKCLHWLDDTGQFIDKTNKMLDEFEKDDARWGALRKKLGLDF